MTVFPDPSTPFGERVASRLATSKVAWLTTVGADGTPQPNPVWFVLDGETAIVYNRADAKRLAHIARNPRVALHLDGDGQGDDIIILTGTAEVVADPTPADQLAAYTTKYGVDAAGISGDAAAFAAEYHEMIKINIDRVRGF